MSDFVSFSLTESSHFICKTFTWTIDNISKYAERFSKGPEFFVKSSVFRPMPNSNSEWMLILGPCRGPNTIFTLKPVSGEKLKASWKYWVVDMRGIQGYKSRTLEFMADAEICGHTFPLEKLMKSSMQFLHNDTLTFKIEARFSYDRPTMIAELYQCEKVNQKREAGVQVSAGQLAVGIQTEGCSENGFRHLSAHLKAVLEKQAFTDVILRDGEKEYLLHKCILSAQSPKFHELLEKDNCIDICGFDSAVIHTMITYMYTAEMGDLTVDLALGLFQLSLEYQVKDLTQNCRRFLIANMKADSICSILEVSATQNEDDLQIAAEDYIVANSIDILCRKDWELFAKKNSSFAVRVLTKCFMHHVIVKNQNANVN